jgi:KH domain
VRYIIGRQGSTIKDIRSTFTKAEVHIPKLLDETLDSVQTVRVTGPRENALECAKFILATVNTKAFAHEHPQLRRHVSSDPKSTLLRLQQEQQQVRQQREPFDTKAVCTGNGNGRARREPAHRAESQQQQQQQQQARKDIDVVRAPKHLLQAVLGAERTLAALCTRYSVLVDVRQPSRSDPESMGRVIIKGDAERITECAHAVMQLLDDAAAEHAAEHSSEGASLPPAQPSQQQRAGPPVQVPVTVRRELIKHIIGKAGINVQRLVKTYSIKLLRPHADESTASEQLVVEGSTQESAAACAADITAMAERYARQLQRTTTDHTTTAAAAPGTGTGESFLLSRPLASQQLAPVQRSRGGLVRALVPVPAGAMGYIVGKQRCTLRALQSRYCVQIVRPAATATAATDDDDGSQVLYVQSRDADSVQACVTCISAMLIERQSETQSPSVRTSTGESSVLTSALTQLLLQQPATAQQQQQQEEQQHVSAAAVQQQQQQQQQQEKERLNAVAAPDGTRVCIAVHVPRALIYRITNRTVTLHKHHSVNVLRPNASAAAAAGTVEVLGIAAPTVQQAEAGIAAIEATLAEYLQGGTLHRERAPCVYMQGERGELLMLASLQQRQQQLQLQHNEGAVFTAASSDVSSLSDAAMAEPSGSDSMAVVTMQSVDVPEGSQCADSILRPILGFNEIMRQYRTAHRLTRQRLTRHADRQQ